MSSWESLVEKSDITFISVDVRKTSLPNKRLKEIKVIKEKQLKLPRKTEKGELTLAQFEVLLENGRIL